MVDLCEVIYQEGSKVLTDAAAYYCYLLANKNVIINKNKLKWLLTL